MTAIQTIDNFYNIIGAIFEPIITVVASTFLLLFGSIIVVAFLVLTVVTLFVMCGGPILFLM